MQLESGEQPRFQDPKDEAEYWKQLAEDYLQKLQEVRDEFDDFQEGSRELEAELEAQLEQYEQRVKDLLGTKTMLEEENEILKQKLETTQRDSYSQITNLQDENTNMKNLKEEMTKYIRELEQVNDDLERAKRATICSLEEFDTRLNTAIERNAFLENELEEKEELTITVQRLKDEAKDLRSELAVNSSKSPISKAKLNAAQDTADGGKHHNANPLTTPRREFEKNRTNSLLNSMNTPNSKNSTNPMTPSARISALNIVSDLLRKVGALETKLASCRNFVQEHPKGNAKQSTFNTPITETPKGKSKVIGQHVTKNQLNGVVKGK